MRSYASGLWMHAPHKTSLLLFSLSLSIHTLWTGLRIVIHFTSLSISFSITLWASGEYIRERVSGSWLNRFTRLPILPSWTLITWSYADGEFSLRRTFLVTQVTQLWYFMCAKDRGLHFKHESELPVQFYVIFIFFGWLDGQRKERVSIIETTFLVVQCQI